MSRTLLLSGGLLHSLQISDLHHDFNSLGASHSNTENTIRKVVVDEKTFNDLKRANKIIVIFLVITILILIIFSWILGRNGFKVLKASSGLTRNDQQTRLSNIIKVISKNTALEKNLEALLKNADFLKVMGDKNLKCERIYPIDSDTDNSLYLWDQISQLAFTDLTGTQEKKQQAYQCINRILFYCTNSDDACQWEELEQQLREVKERLDKQKHQ